MKERIRTSGGIEQDTFSSWRHYLCYLTKSKIKKYAKSKYNRRLRKQLKNIKEGQDE